MSLENKKKPSENAKTDKELEAELNSAELDENELDAVAGGRVYANCQMTEEGCMGVW